MSNRNFLIILLLFVIILLLFMFYNRDSMGIEFDMQRRHFAKEIQVKKKQADYVIPPDEELEKLDKRSDLIVIANRYTDHIDVLCSQQVRVGSVFDGGKHVCVEESIKPKVNQCLVYSFGSRNEFSFETDAIKLFGCDVHTFDPFVTGTGVPKGCTYHSIGLGTKDATANGRKFQTLESIMNDLNHNQRVIDILKIDIDSSEWKVFGNILDGNILIDHVKQISIEIHLPMDKERLSSALRLLRRLNRLGFLTFSRERNVFCKPCTFYVSELDLMFCYVTEFSFLNARFF